MHLTRIGSLPTSLFALCRMFAWWRVCNWFHWTLASSTNSVQQASTNHPTSYSFRRAVTTQARYAHFIPYLVLLLPMLLFSFISNFIRTQQFSMRSQKHWHLSTFRIKESILLADCRSARRCCTYYVPVLATTVTSIQSNLFFPKLFSCFVFVVVISRFVNAFVFHSLVPLFVSCAFRAYFGAERSGINDRTRKNWFAKNWRQLIFFSDSTLDRSQ